jgi:putative transposase
MSMPDKIDVSGSGAVGAWSGNLRWAHFRFSVIGPLLAAPPAKGQLSVALERLASKPWRHPITGQWVRFGASTIERWYYRVVRGARDPVGVLSRKVRRDQGTYRRFSSRLCEAIGLQHRRHPDWSYQLHYDNLAVEAKHDPNFGVMPSCVSLRRYMRAHGMLKRRRLGGRRYTAGTQAAEDRFEALEVRSYESEYVNALWHLDFHHGSVRVLTLPGQWVYPLLLGILDDHSRLCCHVQWYLAESAQNLVHGLCQALLKRGLPRALMSDNGSAMTAGETVQGLERLGIVHERTLPYSPYQNGKQESFWGSVEGRLLSMLDGCPDLSLAALNEATQAWAEMEYNRRVHSATGQTPLARFIDDRDVGRPCGSSEALTEAFTAQGSRTQRRSDGTVSVEGVRFEIPSRYRHLTRVSVRYATWDLSSVYLSDERSGQVLTRIYPLDKHKNADGRRRCKQALAGAGGTPAVAPEPSGMAPLLRKLIAEYAATGIPPAYLPKDENKTRKESNHE